LPRQIQAADDHRQQIVEIMRDAASQLADRVHLLRLDDGVARFVQRALRFASFGQIAGDLGKAVQLAQRVADRIDHDIGPETGAVLADAPSFRFEPALLFGGVERAGGEAGDAVLLAIET